MHLPPRWLAVPVLAAVLAPAAPAQVTVHRARGSGETLEQRVGLLDAWSDGTQVQGLADPHDSVCRLRWKRVDGEQVHVDLTLYGPWGAYLHSFDEERITTLPDLHAHGVRTEWTAMDVDGDGQNEILFVSRHAETEQPLLADGEPVPDRGPRLVAYAVTLTFLDREDGRLVEHELPADPRQPAFAAVLDRELGGAVHAALQQAAGDLLFLAHEFELARYRYRVVREWAQRQLEGGRGPDLTAEMDLPTPDPDDAAVLWVAATRRIESLPPWYQRH
jgi:hypothetical protein